MRRRILILIPIITLFSLVTVMVLVEIRRPPTWQSTLDKYITHLSSNSGHPVSVEAVIQSRKPWNFISEMRLNTYSDGVIFQTISLNQKPTERFITTAILPGEPPLDQRKPLPFPPKEVWCAILKHGKASTVVFLALHEDLYNAEVVVHENPKGLDKQSLQKTLTEVDCD